MVFVEPAVTTVGVIVMISLTAATAAEPVTAATPKAPEVLIVIFSTLVIFIPAGKVVAIEAAASLITKVSVPAPPLIESKAVKVVPVPLMVSLPVVPVMVSVPVVSDQVGSEGLVFNFH